MISLTVLEAGLAQLMPAHLGPLHPVEAGLALVLAAAPFVVLAVVISIRRRRDLAAGAAGAADAAEPQSGPGTGR